MKVTVLGIGNSVMGDDAVGLELMARLQPTWAADARVEFVHGETGGMELLSDVTDAEALLILDAVAGPVPGQAVRIGGDQVPRLLAAKLSPHQVGMLDLLAAARLLGKEPQLVEVVGVTPSDIDIRIGLSETVARGLEDAVLLANQALSELLAA